MATKTVVTMIDDLTEVEGEDVQRREWTIDGVTYEADFSDETWGELLEDLQRYNDVAQVVRRDRGKGKGRGTGQGAGNREESKAIREWAHRQGFEVSERGRIPKNVLDAYHAAA